MYGILDHMGYGKCYHCNSSISKDSLKTFICRRCNLNVDATGFPIKVVENTSDEDKKEEETPPAYGSEWFGINFFEPIENEKSKL